jgi:methionyl-tRNA synthetase
MITRVEPAQLEAMINESKEEFAVNQSEANAAPPAETADSAAPLEAEPLVAEQISIDDFTKVDLRVARVIAAEEVPKAKKLLKLTLSLGGDQRRTVFAGIKSAYEPQKLVGRLVVCVANLAPRQMTFGVSEGMVVAAGTGGTEIFLLGPDSGAKPGQRVH